MHFLYITINSLLPKINELKCIANKAKSTIIRITELKLDHTVSDLEVNIPGYDISDVIEIELVVVLHVI